MHARFMTVDCKRDPYALSAHVNMSAQADIQHSIKRNAAVSVSESDEILAHLPEIQCAIILLVSHVTTTHQN